MPTRRFFSLARRLPHYEGAMRHAAMLELQDAQTDDPEPAAAPQARRIEADPGNDDAIAANVDLMAVHPVWGSVGSYAKAPAQEAS